MIEVVGNAGERLDEIMLPKVQSAAEVRGARPAADPGREEVGPAGRAHRHRGADRDRARAHQRRRDLRGVAPARDDHLRPGRLRREHRDAGAHRRRRHPRVPRRPLPLRVQPHPHGRPGQRAAGDRRAVPQGARARRAARLLHAHAHARLRRQVGAHARPGHGPQRGVLADPGAVRPRLRHPRGLPEGHRGGPQGRGDVRRRDDRRGQPQDRHEVRQPRRAGRPDAAAPASRQRSPALSQPISRRAITFSASVSSAPSKIDSTRASTK